jgi:hypothetical protein
MIYTINAKIAKRVDLNAGEMAKNGEPIAEDLIKRPFIHEVFKHKPSAEMTATQIKDLVSQRLSLPNTIEDVVLTSNGKIVNGSDLVKSYTVVYTGIMPKDGAFQTSETSTTTSAPVVETTTEAPVVETTTEAPVVETTTEAPVVETTTEAPVVETTTEAPAN